MASTKPIQRYTLQDWLTLHQLTKQHVRTLCRTPVQYLPFAAHSQTSSLKALDRTYSLSAQQAWALASEALCHQFPTQSSTINAVKNSTRLHLKKSANHQRTYTYKDPVTQTITVACPYQPTPKFLLYIAHEFSHALHYSLLDQCFPPPIQRETCAFLGELCLLDYLDRQKNSLYPTILMLWQRQNTQYLGHHLSGLLQALDNNSDYQYFWNYPIARINAIEYFKNLNSMELWRLFSE